MNTFALPGAVAALLAIAALALPAGAALGGRVGVAGPVVPSTQSTLPDGTAETLAAGRDIVAGEKITTDAQGQTDILFLDQSSLRIAPNSELVVDELAYSPEDGSGSLVATASKGLMRFNGGALSKHEGGVKIRTPTAILGVRGGVVLVEITADGGTRATFLYGNALTITSPGGEVVRITRPGFFAEIGPGGKLVAPPAPATPAALAAAIKSLAANAASGQPGADKIAIALKPGTFDGGPQQGTPTLATLSQFLANTGTPLTSGIVHNLNDVRLSPATPTVSGRGGGGAGGGGGQGGGGGGH